MTTTNNALFVLSLFFLVGCEPRLENSSQKGREAHEPSLRNHRECWGSANPKNVQVCAINFDELAARPDQFDGLYIKVVGYAVVAGEYTYLYSSKDDFTYSAGRGGIDISIAGEARQEFALLAKSNQHATAVIGQFHAWRGRLKGSLGAISGPNVIFFEEVLPWEMPPLPPGQKAP